MTWYNLEKEKPIPMPDWYHIIAQQDRPWSGWMSKPCMSSSCNEQVSVRHPNEGKWCSKHLRQHLIDLGAIEWRNEE